MEMDRTTMIYSSSMKMTVYARPALSITRPMIWNYSILVAVTDEHNLSIERTFTIPLLNIVEDLDSDGIEDFYDKDDDNDGFPDTLRDWLWLESKGC